MRAYELDSLISESARLFCLFSQPKRLINAMNSQLSTEIRSPHSRRKRKSRNPGVLEVLLVGVEVFSDTDWKDSVDGAFSKWCR